MEKVPFYILLASISIFLLSCDEEQINKPVLKTLDVSELTPEGVTLNGEILATGSHSVEDYGFAWTDSAGTFTITHSFNEMPGAGKFSYRLTDGMLPGKSYYVKAFVVTQGVPQYGSRVRFRSQGSSAPVVLDFTPKEGTSGTVVTLTGNNLGNASVPTTIAIAGQTCEVLSVTSTAIEFVTPLDYETGSYPIALTSANTIVTSADHFTLLGPMIQSVTPASGPAGIAVTINGSGFSTTSVSNVVYFGDKPATVTSASSTELKVIVPVSSVAGEKAVTVRVNRATTNKLTKFNLTGPTIAYCSPASGPPGTVFTIHGSGFSSVPSENLVQLWYNGGFQPEVISASENQLVVKIPESYGTATSEAQLKQRLQVTTRTISATLNEAFAIEGPWITGYSPSAQVEGGEVTILGKNFTGYGPTIVYFGYSDQYYDVKATILDVTATSITVKIPFGSAIAPSLPDQCTMYVKVGSWTLNSPNLLPIRKPWTSLPAFPGPFRYGSVAFTVGAYAYYMTGNDHYFNRLRDVWRYDASNNSWTQLANFPGQTREFAFSFVINGKAYVGGGTGGTNANLYDLWEFDPATGVWTQKQSFPATPAGRRFAATSVGGYGYFVVSNSLFKYDPVLNQWSVSTAPTTFARSGIAANIGNKGYFGLGENNSELWEFNPATDTWTLLPPSLFKMPPNWGPLSSIVVNGKLYVIDHYTVTMYDPSTNQWKRVSYLTTDTTRDNCTFSVGDTGFLVGGRGASGGKFFSFNPDL